MPVEHVTLPKIGGTTDARGGWFWWEGPEILIVRCPKCLREQRIGENHTIVLGAFGGVVHPSIGCYTVGGCPWHVYATLDGYGGERSQQ